MELPQELDVEGRLLPGLAGGGRLERLTVIDEAAGDGPAGRRVAAPDENDPSPAPGGLDLDNDVHGRDGVSEFSARHGFLGRPPL